MWEKPACDIPPRLFVTVINKGPWLANIPCWCEGDELHEPTQCDMLSGSNFRTMSEGVQTTSGSRWKSWLLHRVAELRQREGADLPGTGAGDRRINRAGGRRVHPADGTNGDAAVSPWAARHGDGCCSRLWGRSASVTCCIATFPVPGAAGVPQTKAALFAREGRITLRTVLGKFFCNVGNAG